MGKAARINLISEKQFRQMILELAKLNGWKSYFTWSSIHSPKGMLDLILARPPELIIVELKSATGKLTKEQAEWLHVLGECHVEVDVWRPDDWDSIVRRLQK